MVKVYLSATAIFMKSDLLFVVPAGVSFSLAPPLLDGSDKIVFLSSLLTHIQQQASVSQICKVAIWASVHTF